MQGNNPGAGHCNYFAGNAGTLIIEYSLTGFKALPATGAN